jgi:hypothetical protein
MRVRGTTHVFVAFDLGFEIDLARAAARLGTGTRAGSFRHKAPRDEAAALKLPLRFTLPAGELALGSARTRPELAVALYSFGAASFTYELGFDGELEELVARSELLYDNATLLEDARARARTLLAHLGDAVRDAQLAETVEDYVVHRFDPPGPRLSDLEGEERERLARVLRAERGALSPHEVENALEGLIAYGPGEIVAVDWLAALLSGADVRDELAVLELATVELAELRFLDERLERRLDEAYGLLARARTRFRGLGRRSAELERLARFQADSAILHENFDNALKLLGDDYLARLYELCSERFHFGAWDAAIERKLATLESIYSKLSDEAARRRSELLEWIIILLFLVDIALIFLREEHGAG